jgi:transposase
MARPAWEISDEFWAAVEPLLPARERRFRYPGRKGSAVNYSSV